ncbi:TIGR01620 family protein [Pseudaeromonas paramecii]|uniref:TIGR01620 family protein n=1 Tax=Pseudaeromonas paramecii TaxID=2138166 RepID=A0ABP8PTU2_9GAMM
MTQPRRTAIRLDPAELAQPRHAERASPVDLAGHLPPETEVWQDPEPPVPPEPPLPRLGSLGWGVLGVLGLGTVQLAWWLVDRLGQGVGLAWLWLPVLALVVIGAGGRLFKEWRQLRRLKRLARWRAEAPDGKANYLPALAKACGLADTEGYARWQSQCEPHHSPAEQQALFSQLVLGHADNLARQQIVRWSSEAAVLVAISPLAIVDMLLVLWRSLRMLDAIADCYGVSLGYWSRITLLRQILRHAIYIGAAEAVTEVGLDWLGAELTARLSTRVAQGLGAGLLCARLGIQAMSLCRPLSFSPNERPRLAQIRLDLLQHLKRQLGNLFSKDQAS